MTNTNSPADQLRAALKLAGYSRTQVSVKHDKYSMGSCLRVTIRDLSIPLSVVKTIASSYEKVARDHMTGEILSGGNRHLDVDYEDSALREYARVAVLPQLYAIPAGQALDVLVMGQSIRIAKIVNDRCAWQSEIVALDYQTDPDLRVRCYYTPELKSDLVLAGQQIVKLAIELAFRARVSAEVADLNAEIEQAIPTVTDEDAEHCCCSCGGTFAAAEVTVTEDSADHQSAICHGCAPQEVTPAPENDWSIGI